MPRGLSRDPLERLVRIVEDVQRARADLDGLLDARDAVIREALAEGHSYAELTEATGLSRSALDTIRQGQRRRGR